MLSKKEFDILVSLTEAKGMPSQRQLSASTGHSLGTVNKLVRLLREKAFLSDAGISEAGLAALEPYRARRAIFAAAGFGSRLAPVTLDMPKPLIPVCGKRLIDGLIDAVLAAGIEEIIVVRGYMAGAFDVLKEKYPMIRFVENPRFAEANNILSALCVKDYLKNTYIFDADLKIENPKIIKKYHYSSDFLGIPTSRTDDWCFTVKNGIVQEELRGGIDVYRIIGISYWNEADGQKLAEDLEKTVAMPGGREFYWEQVPFHVFKGSYKVAIRPCREEDIQEIDTFNELKAIDPGYENYAREEKI